MKTYFRTSLLFAALLLAAATELSAQISGQVVNLTLNRYNSATNGAKLTVNDGENLAVIQWRGWTPGQEYQTSASIGVDVTGTPLDGFLPSRMNFYTGAFSQIERMTILENGNIGIGLSDPAALLDVNGNAIVRGQRLSLGLGSAFADGGEALTHTSTGGLMGLPGDVLTINRDGGFEGGVFIDCPGLRVCGATEMECLSAERSLVSQMGNVLALGGEAIAVDCNSPGEGDFISYGANGDFIAQHGDFLAMEGDVIASLGDVRATAGSIFAGQNITAQNGGVTAQSHIVSNAGNVEAALDLIAGDDVTVGDELTVANRAAIGTIDMPAGYRLYVAEGILTEKVKVAVESSSDWADYVFSPEYDLRPLAEVENFVNENCHLPGLPSAEEVVQNGVDLAKMDALLLEKIEELTLYLIDLKKENESLRKELEDLKKRDR